MSRKSVPLTRLVFILGLFFALNAWAGLSFSPSSVTGTIHYSPASPSLTVTSPTAAAVNNANQTLTGSLGTGGNLSINGVNVPLNPDHSFSYPLTLAQGVNNIALLGVDLGGNRVSLTKTITLDTTPPDAPNTTLISVSAPAGGVVTLTGAAGAVDPNTQITILDVTSGVSVSVTSDATGAFTTTLAAQAGDQLTITATDEAGNTSSAADHVPAVAPVITVTSPTVTLTNKPNITVAGSLNEPATLTINGATVTVNSDLTFSYAMTLNQGQNTITLIATDPEGDNGSKVVTITLDTTAPTVPNLSLISATAVTNGQTTVTGLGGSVDPNIQLTITDQTTAGASVTVTSGSAGAFAATLAAHPSDVLMITATDAAGNTSAAAIQVPGPNTAPPLVTLTNPIINPSQPTATYTNQQKFTFTGYMSEPGTLYLVDYSGTNKPITVNPDLSFSYTVTLQEGNNSYNFLVYNTAKVEGTQYLGVSIVFNNIPPTVAITSSPYTGLTNYTLTGTIAGEVDVTVEPSVNGVAVPVTYVQNQGFSFSYPATLTAGANNFTIVVTDLTGNVTTASFTAALNTGAPTLAVTSPALTNQVNYTLTGQLTKEGSVVVNGAVATVNPGLSFSYATTLVEGPNTFDIVAMDTGDSQQVTQTVTVVLDNIAPTITITAPDGPYTNQANITLMGSLSEAATFTINGTAVPLNPDLSFSYPLPVTQGENDFNLAATDPAGNQTDQSWSIIVDSVPPVINFPLLAATDSSGGQAWFSGGDGAIDNSPNNDSEVNVTVSDVANGQSAATSVNGSGGFAVSLLASAEDPFNITAVDGASNVTSMRVQFGTACYADPATQNTTLAVGAGSGTVTRPVGNAVVFHVTRTGPQNFDSYVDYTTADGTAVAGQDYTSESGSLKIPAGAAGADLSIPLLGSSGNAPDKTFTLQILGTHNPITTNGLSGTSGIVPRDVYPVGNTPFWAVTADINGDGMPDIITANNNPNPNDPNGTTPYATPGTVSVLLNTTQTGAAKESFAVQQTITAGLGPYAVAAADVDGDGKVDVIVSNDGDNDVMVFLNTTPAGSGTVSFATSPLILPTGKNPDYLAVADVNGDGKPDIIVGNWGSNSVQVFLNTSTPGAVSFASTPVEIDGINQPDGLAVGDLNGDGLPDIVVTNFNNGGTSPGGVTVLLNTTANGTVSFAAQPEISVDAAPAGVVIADINGDGKPDLAVATANGPGSVDASGNPLSNSIDVLLQTTTGASGLSFSAPYELAVGVTPESVAAVDLDGDGKPDLVVGNTAAMGNAGAPGNTISVLFNTTAPGAATPSFSPQLTYGTGSSPWPVLTADLNGDGKPDIITVDEDDSTVSVLMNRIGDAGAITYGSCVAPASVTGTVHYAIVPPVIALTSPTGTTFQFPYQTLSGSVSSSNPGPVTLTINGGAITLNPDNTFSLPITLQSGVNTYTLVATDSYGNPTTVTLTLTLNSASLAAPTATSIQFQSGGSGQVTIVGQPGSAPPGDTVTVMDITDGQSGSSTVNADGSYSVTLTGSLSDNFSVTLSDSSGDESPPVYQNGNDPTLGLTLSSPCAGAACNSTITVNGDTINIAGLYTGPAGTGITVNGGLAHLGNGSFYVNNLPLTAGANTVTIVATSPGGLSTSQTLSINSTGTSTLVLRAMPNDMGVAPYAVSFTYSFQGTATIQTVEMSYLGNGTNDVVSNDPANVILAYTYINPGTYPATLTLIDTNGVQYQAQVQVVVQDPSWADAAIHATWNNFITGLKQGNRAEAMGSLDYEAQLEYAPVVDTLLGQMPQIVGSFSPLFHGVSMGGRAEYTVVRVINGQAQVFFIYFIQDSDGVWRVDAM